jgi:hypothetical protein
MEAAGASAAKAMMKRWRLYSEDPEGAERAANRGKGWSLVTSAATGSVAGDVRRLRLWSWSGLGVGGGRDGAS